MCCYTNIGLRLIIAVTIGCAEGNAQLLNNTNDKYVIAREKWENMTQMQIENYQITHHCCNFNTLFPCCRINPGGSSCANQYVCSRFLVMNITNSPSSMPTNNPLTYDEKNDENDKEDQYNGVAVFGFISIGFVFAIFILFVVYLIMRCNGYHFVKNSENVQQTYQLMKDGFL
eukprot:246495_1